MQNLKKDKEISIFILMILLIPFLMIPNFVYEFSTQKNLVFSVFSFILFSYFIFKKNDEKLNFSYTHLFFLLFGFSSLLSLISVQIQNPSYINYSLNVSLYIFVIIGISLTITNSFGKNFKYIEYALMAFIITGTILAIDGLLNKFLGFDLFFGKIGDPSQRITLRTTIGNPNFVSDYLAQTIPLSIYFILKPNSKLYQKIYLYINIFLSFWVVLFAQTRSVYLGFTVGLIFFILSLLISKKDLDYKKYLISKDFWIKIFLLIFILVFLFIMFNTNTMFNKSGEVNAISRFSAMSSKSSWDERNLSWMVSIEQFKDKDYPLNKIIGGGIGTYPVYSIKYMEEIQAKNPEKYYYAWNNFKRAHNDYLQVLGETGLLGIISISLLIITLLMRYFKILRSDIEFEKKIMISLFGWIASIIIIHAATEFALHMQPNILIALFIFSIAMSKQFSNSNKILKFNPKIIYTILVIITAFSVFFKYKDTMSEAYFKLGDAENTKMNYYIEIYQSQIPQQITQYENEIKKRQDYIKNMNPFSSEFNSLKKQIDELNEGLKKYKNLQIEYKEKAHQSYKKAFEYFLKSLDFNNNFGKSQFYLAQLFSVSEFRLEEILNTKDLNDIFEGNTSEYKYIVKDFKGQEDLFPISNPIRKDVSNLYNISTTTNEKNILLNIQMFYDQINYLESAFLSFNEKNSYRLISKLYYNIIKLYDNIEKNTNNEKLKIELQNKIKEDYKNFIYWNEKSISIIPGGWNRFPEWENVYFEYSYLSINLMGIIPSDEILNNLYNISKKEGKANYYMAKKDRGIPDKSLKLFIELYLQIPDTQIREDITKNIINSYNDVYNFYKNKEEKNEIKNSYLERYESRIKEFLDNYEYFKRKIG